MTQKFPKVIYIELEYDDQGNIVDVIAYKDVNEIFEYNENKGIVIAEYQLNSVGEANNVKVYVPDKEAPKKK